jgi:hypothetical protein
MTCEHLALFIANNNASSQQGRKCAAEILDLKMILKWCIIYKLLWFSFPLPIP